MCACTVAFSVNVHIYSCIYTVKVRIYSVNVHIYSVNVHISVADPGFPVGGGGMDLIGGPWTPEVAMFRKFCMSKRKNLDP